MSNTNTEILILGGGSFARSIADAAEEIPGNTVIGFVVDLPPFVKGSKIANKPVFWIDELADMDRTYQAVCALGSMKRADLIKKVKSFGFSFINIVHPSAYISTTAQMGTGVIINSGVHIATNAIIGNHVVINRGVLIGHDGVINDYCVISPGVNIASFVNVGARTQIKMGVNIIEHINIGEDSIIGAGSLVTKDIPNKVKVVGMPARVIERDIKEV